MFQHTAARRRLDESYEDAFSSAIVSTHSRPKAAGSTFGAGRYKSAMFQHTAARRRLGQTAPKHQPNDQFQHTAARRRLVYHRPACMQVVSVSTHSRPKAAGQACSHARCGSRCFNTQPPEGGWLELTFERCIEVAFQHTAARRRLAAMAALMTDKPSVSTHSRPKAAGQARHAPKHQSQVSTHSRPKAAGTSLGVRRMIEWVSTHSRPKAAGCCGDGLFTNPKVSTHSRPKAAGKAKQSRSTE